MTSDAAVDILWEAMQKGVYFPEILQGKLSLEEGYRAQLGILARHVAAGEKQAGWKIALSGEATRQAIGVYAPAFGYLLASSHFSSGQTFQSDDIFNSAIESELCLTLGTRLQGPGVTRAQVLEAVASLEPAFEIISLRGNLAADMPLGVADNIAQWGYVTGDTMAPYPKALDLAALTVEVKKNGQVEARARGAEALDDPLDSIAWLANELAKYDIALEAGHAVMTGSFTRPLPITKGDQWETHFASIGTITASFV
ncbi:MAG: fumarylacetoacetate hydrolase family protein [Candidatus Tectomicrobia bacterium]